MPLHFKGLRPIFVAGHLNVQVSTETYKNLAVYAKLEWNLNRGLVCLESST